MSNLSSLVRWSGLASIVGGLLFPVGIAMHPLRHGQAVNDSPYSAVHVLIAVALMLVLFGLVGLYARQADQLGRLGLTGFILAFVGNLWTYGLIITEGFLWPAVGQYDPAAVHELDPNTGGAPGRSLLLIFFVGLTLFAVGYALFGRAAMRAGVLPSWGGLLIAVGAVLYVIGGSTLPLLGPESALVTVIETSGAVPFGVGFVWLGYALRSGADGVRRTAMAIAQ